MGLEAAAGFADVVPNGCLGAALDMGGYDDADDADDDDDDDDDGFGFGFEVAVVPNGFLGAALDMGG